MALKLGLERTCKLLHLIGNPQNSFKIIHIGGTNGKGSISAFISSMLDSLSIKVGRYNSPHFIHEYDSIHIFEKVVSEQKYNEAREKVMKANLKDKLQASQFELLTATAFLCFYMEKVDVAVVEVGLGGRLDATNICHSSNYLASVLASIGIDHQFYLGNTVEEITTEKSGIIREKVPVIIAPQTYKSVEQILSEKAKQLDAPVYSVTSSIKHPTQPNTAIHSFFNQKDFAYPLPLHGTFQLDNSAVALTTVEVVLKQLLENKSNIYHPPSTEEEMKEKIIKGISRVRWPGRLEWIENEKCGKILLDGAHNMACAVALKEYIDECLNDKSYSYQNRTIQWVFGMTQGKDMKEVLDILIRPEDQVFCVPFSQPEQMTWIHCVPPVELKEFFWKKYNDKYTKEELKHKYREFQNVSEAFSLLDKERTELKKKDKENREPLVVVCGSLYLVAEVYRYLYGKEKSVQSI